MFCIGKYCQLFTHKRIVDQYHDQYAVSLFKSMDPKFRKMPKTMPETDRSLEARGLPSNTWMPGPTPLTMPNDSSIAVRNSTQRCNKFPIGYNRTPQIHPSNCPFPFDDHQQNLIHPYRARPHSPPQMASGFHQPFCHSTHVRTDTGGRHSQSHKHSAQLFW